MTDKVNRINHLLARSAHLREQMEAVAEEFVELHGYKSNSWQSVLLKSVCWFGEDYQEVLHNVMSKKKKG